MVKRFRMASEDKLDIVKETANEQWNLLYEGEFSNIKNNPFMAD